MLGQLKKLGKQTVIYSFGNILNKLLGFILIPIYGVYISIGDFGILAVLEIIVLFLTSVIHFGIISGHQRYFYIEKEKGNYGVFLFSNYIGHILLSLIVIFPFFIYSQSASNLFFSDVNQAANLRMALWITLAEIAIIIPLQILQFEEKPIFYLLLSFFKLALSLVLTIYFVVYHSQKLEGIINARLIGAVVAAIISIIVIIIPRCKIGYSFESLKKSLVFGFPIIFSTIGYQIFAMNDRFMLNWLCGESETGKYSFGFKIANFINFFFIQSINISYLPSIFSKENDKNNARYYRKMLTYYTFTISFIILAFLLFYKDLIVLFIDNKDYLEGLKVVPILSLGFIVMGMNYFLCVGFYITNKSVNYMYSSLISAFINIFLNFWLISKIGMIGAACSTLIAHIINTAIIAYISNRLYKVDFEWKKISLVFFISILFFIFYEFMSIELNWIRYFIAAGIIIVFPFCLYLLNFFEPIEIESIKKGFRKIVSFSYFKV